MANLTYHSAPWIGKLSPTTAIANSRTLGVVIAGLLGGVPSGLIVGAVSGVHRYSLGGFVAVPCMIAPILQGLLAGLCRNAFRRRFRDASSERLALLVGFSAEALQMALIAALARPFDDAVDLVRLIGLPQVAANSVGVALYFMLHRTMEREEQRIGMEYAHKALQIADRTMPLWRLEFKRAVREIAKTLHQETRAVGVSFSKNGSEWVTVGRKTRFGIDLHLETPNHAPRGQFRLFFPREQDDHESFRLMLKSLAGLLSQQYASVEAERQAQLLADAEIRSLQAQMNPHFLFNALNTVKSFIRTRPADARLMIMHLSKFLRKNMNNGNQSTVPIREEIELVTSYLNLIKARQGERLEFEADVDEHALDRHIPPFTIQPLVENAILHGISSMNKTGVVRVSVKEERQDGGAAKVRVTVEDNGKGLAEGQTGDSREHAGIALRNIEQRLKYHYGDDRPLSIESSKETGTKISFWVG